MGTRIVFGGGEVGSHRTLLLGQGVTSISVNYWRLKQRGLPTTKQYLFADRVPEGIDIHLDPGSASATEALSQQELSAYAKEYTTFADINRASLDAVVEFDSPAVDARWMEQHRQDLINTLGIEWVWPVWHHDRGAHLEALSERFSDVAIPGESIEADTTLAGRLKALQGRHGTTWHGLAHARPDDLRSLPLATVSTLAWLSPTMRGETVVWDGTRLVRYPAGMKDQARMRLAGVCERAGLDFEKIRADDAKEVTRLAVWSLLQLEAHMATGRDKKLTTPDNVIQLSAHSGDRGNGEVAETGPEDADNRGMEVRKQETLIQRPANEQMTLPVLGFEITRVVEKGDDGTDVIREVPIARSNQNTLRQCNTCFVAANCPAFKPDNTCAFNLPIEVRTKEQLKGLLQAMLEMQGSRVAFGRFSEELNGGYPDPNLSQEMDRLFKLVKILKELEQNNEFVRMTVERQTSGGVLSAIFGDRAQTPKELPNGGLDANATNRLIDGGV